jgi:two-component system, chemotaxis family, protein-glutamate methylesterase/glutaminase
VWQGDRDDLWSSPVFLQRNIIETNSIVRTATSPKEQVLSERRILVVESEQVLGNAIRRYFERMGHVLTVVSAVSPSDALVALQDQPLDLVLSVHQGPDGVDALHVLQGVREQDVSVRTVVLADHSLRADRNRALTLGCTTFLVQPVPHNQLFDLILNMLQPHQGFAGRLIAMRLEDVLQMFCYRRDTTLVTVFSEENNVGSIYVSDGGIIHADCENLAGVDAAYEILGWESGEFYSQVVFEVPEQTIFIDSQSLLVEGMRQKDEILHALGPVPGAQPAVQGTDRAHGTPQPAPRRDEVVRRIMIVDDSRFIRKIVYEILKADSGLTVAGYASNGQEALAKIDSLKPDLILLDWDMPVMKGSTTLMHIMIRSPCPVVILSGFVGGVGANPFDLLCLGGVDFLRKPQSNWRLDGRADDLVRRVKEACAIKFDRIRRVKTPSPTRQPSSSEPEFIPARFLSVFGSFIGGCSDLIRVIPLLPEDLPSALVVIHDMQPEVVGAFVDYLDRRSRIPVRQLEPGVRLSEGVCYIHPAMAPVELVREGEYTVAKNILEIPYAHVLDHFLVSASRIMGRNLLAVLFSGGSGGGIEGLRAVKQMEGVTMVQDPASCVDPRMAEAALQEGLVDYKCSADTLAETFRKLMSTVHRA